MSDLDGKLDEKQDDTPLWKQVIILVVFGFGLCALLNVGYVGWMMFQASQSPASSLQTDTDGARDCAIEYMHGLSNATLDDRQQKVLVSLPGGAVERAGEVQGNEDLRQLQFRIVEVYFDGHEETEDGAVTDYKVEGRLEATNLEQEIFAWVGVSESEDESGSTFRVESVRIE